MRLLSTRVVVLLMLAQAAHAPPVTGGGFDGPYQTSPPTNGQCQDQKAPCGHAPCRHVYVKVPQKELQPDEETTPETAPEAGPGGGPGGVFQAPPRTGTVVGPTRSIGVRGLALHFPELTLRLPTLELPSLSRYHSGSRMEIESAVAPFVSQPAGFGMGMPHARRSSVGKSADETAPDATAEDDTQEQIDEVKESCEDLLQKRQELQQRLEEMDCLLKHLQSLPQCSPPPACGQPMVPSDLAPLPPPPVCDPQQKTSIGVPALPLSRLPEVAQSNYLVPLSEPAPPRGADTEHPRRLPTTARVGHDSVRHLPSLNPR